MRPPDQADREPSRPPLGYIDAAQVDQRLAGSEPIYRKVETARPASRTCKFAGCEQYVVDHGLCVRHGVSSAWHLASRRWAASVLMDDNSRGDQRGCDYAAGREAVPHGGLHLSSQALWPVLATRYVPCRCRTVTGTFETNSWRAVTGRRLHRVQNRRLHQPRQVARLLLVARRRHQVQGASVRKDRHL